MKALVVVAHPDDHVLWLGGTISRLKDWEWHIISLCNSHNDNFAPKLVNFESSCKALGAKRFAARQLRDYQQRELMEIEQPVKMQKEILSFADREYDLIFTHSISPNCEYGFHANHTETRNAVNSLTDESLLRTKIMLYFSYHSGGASMPVIADVDGASYKVELTPDEISRKKDLKHSFSSWAEGDLKSLGLWDNDEPKIEAFTEKRVGDISLPADFIKL